MKTKISITIILTFISLSLFSQIKKGDTEFSLDANVFYTNYDISNTPIKTTIKTISINSGISAKYYFKDFLSVGVGLKYSWLSQEVENTIHNDSFILESTHSEKIKFIIPSIKLGYKYEIIKDLYVKASLNTNYGIASYSDQSNYVGIKSKIPEIYQLESGNIISSGKFNNLGKFNFISIDIKPKIQYYFNNKIGLTLGFGSAEYFANQKLFLFTFGPAFWTLGLDVKF